MKGKLIIFTGVAVYIVYYIFFLRALKEYFSGVLRHFSFAREWLQRLSDIF